MEKFMPNDDFIQEEIVNSEPETDSDNISIEEEKPDIDIKLAKNEYDQKVPAEEIENFQKEIIKKIEDKAMEFGISKEDLVNLNDNFDNLSEKIKIEGERIGNDELERVGQDAFPNISLEDLKENIEEIANELEMSKEDIDGIVKMIEASDFEKDIEEKAEKLKISKDVFYEFAESDLRSLDKENLKALKMNRKEFDFIKYDTEDSINKIGFQDSPNKCIELIKKHKGIISLGQLSLYLSTFGTPFIDNLCSNNVKIIVDSSSENYQVVTIENLVKNPEYMEILEGGPNKNSPIDVVKYFDTPDPLEFENGSIEFRKAVFSDQDSTDQEFMQLQLASVDGRVKNYFNLSDDFKNNGLESISSKGLKMDDFLNNQGTIVELISKNLNIPKELVESYIKDFMTLNVSKISVVPYEEIELDNNTKFSLDDADLEKKGIVNKFKEFKEIKQQFETEENFDKFESELFKILEKEGETIDTLKDLGEKDPKGLIERVAEIIAKNIEYDQQESQYIDNKEYDKLEEKHKEGISFITLKTGLGVCHDKTKVLGAALFVLEQNGVKNLDKIALLATSSDKTDHEWSMLLRIKQEQDENINLQLTYLDLTYADDDNPDNVSKVPERLNAVDQSHYYTSIAKKIENSHNIILDKIDKFNKFVKQKKLEEILTQYDSRHKQQIEGNKKLRETEKGIRAPREERMKNVKNSLKSARNKLKKIYAGKDSENE